MINKKAFTLLELLVVVLIIGILAGIALPQYQQATYKAKYATVLPMVRAVGNAMERYYLLHSTYPTRINDIDISLESNDIEDDNGRDLINFPWGFCYFSKPDAGNTTVRFACGLIKEKLVLAYFVDQKRFQCNAISPNNKTKQYKFCYNLPGSTYRNTTQCKWTGDELSQCYTFTFKP